MTRLPFDRDSAHADIIRQMGETEDLRELRRQAERIEHDRKHERDAMFQKFEKDRLRRQIRQAGEKPCR